MVWVDFGGRRLPGQYGDGDHAARDEYRAATEACAIFDLPERGIVEVAGPQRVDFLERILSNDVAGLSPGAGRLAALMNTKGHLLALMRVLAESKRVLLELDNAAAPGVVEALEYYRVAAPVKFGRPQSSLVGLVGPGAPGLLEALQLPVPRDVNSHASGSADGFDLRIVQASDLPRGTFVIHAGVDSAERLWRRLIDAGARPAGRRALDALRIEQRRPLYGFDIGEENLLHETGLLDEYHSAAKGCYVGQEVVARLEARGGHVSRRLLGLRLGEPTAPGAGIISEGAVVGSVTTAAVSPGHGPVAMGYLRRRAAEPGRRVTVGAAEATVVTLPLSDAAGESR